LRFWDASAIIRLFIEEAGTELVRTWLQEDASMAVWALTRVEVVSAIERRAREGHLSTSQRLSALDTCEKLLRAAHELSDVLAVRSRALPLLGRYPLRAADAAQLGAASLLAESDVSSLPLVALDRQLADAARREGYRVLTWPDDDEGRA
jgi:predicted nucleic acid-binding protein